MKLKQNTGPIVSLDSRLVCLGFSPVHIVLPFLALGAACSVLFTTRATASTDDAVFMVNVRTAVEREYTLFSKKPAAEHSKLYAIGGIQLVRGNSALSPGFADPLVAPVNEYALMQKLREALAARGFHEPAPGKVPDIVITLLYGRSKLRNPYSEGMAVSGGVLGAGDGTNTGQGGLTMGGTPEVTGSMDLLLADRTPGGTREKRIAAENEKVFINVTAWEFPGFAPNAKTKAKQLWRATINVDDAKLDLNAIAGKMLAVASPYFDREIKEKEISISSGLADDTQGQHRLSDAGARH